MTWYVYLRGIDRKITLIAEYQIYENACNLVDSMSKVFDEYCFFGRPTFVVTKQKAYE